MTPSEWILVVLRIAHSAAAVVWLGGGVYFFVALRPAAREADTAGKAVVAAAQQAFGEWSGIATVVLLGSGTVLMFERLSADPGGWTYVILLVAKVVTALWAFALVTARVRRRVRRNSRSRPELIITLGFVTFTIGVLLATLYGRGIVE